MRLDLSQMVERLREEAILPLSLLAGALEDDDDDVTPADVRDTIATVREDLEEWATRFEATVRQFAET